MIRAVPTRAIPLAAAATLLVAGALLAACQGGGDPLAPPDIAYGEDVCDQCGMIISDERFAAAAIVETAPGQTEARRFDDIGDMLAYREANPEVDVRRWWVHDHDSLAWIDAQEATYVQSEAIGSPMGFGLAAFADAAAAEAKLAEWGGETLDFEALSGVAHSDDH